MSIIPKSVFYVLTFAIVSLGHGSVLNEDGEVEMDAIMDGKDLSSRAVSAVTCIAHPLIPFHSLFSKTDHLLLTCKGTLLFAKSQGIPEIPGEKPTTERSRERWKKDLKSGSIPKSVVRGTGTVGAVAVDSQGNVACATSTGGISNKMVGRVGDTPCIGSGGFADNNVGAVSTIGDGKAL
ncbi:unnamed protein product [Staurois parvus]|uniref:Uncharacterized protein n=1 Tax=Staurois parvus TaxID=386267 RepID=A0ABN9G0J0_9NEOB|nr:unnamed protein product [Staurois parvus]